MTIQARILEYLGSGPATMDEIDSHVLYNVSWTPARESIRARVYELLKRGKVVRTAKATYALPKKVRKSKATIQAAA